MTQYDVTAGDRDFEDYKPTRSLTMTQLRRSLAEQIEHVASGGLGVICHRYGRPAAVLVSFEAYERMMELEEFEFKGPYDPKTGHRIGRGAWATMRRMLGWKMFEPQKGTQNGTRRYGPLCEDTAMRDDVGGGKRWR
jgi:prevent-host-death family protein